MEGRRTIGAWKYPIGFPASFMSLFRRLRRPMQKKICSYVLMSKKTSQKKYVLMYLCLYKKNQENMSLCTYVLKTAAKGACPYVLKAGGPLMIQRPGAW